jgi:hypothetical protein
MPFVRRIRVPGKCGELLLAAGLLAGLAVFVSPGQKQAAASGTSEGRPIQVAAAQFQALPPAPGFDGVVSWLNTEQPISLPDLRGRIVLLDFWTLC